MPYSELLKSLIEKKKYSNKYVSKMCEKYGEPIAESYISKQEYEKALNKRIQRIKPKIKLPKPQSIRRDILPQTASVSLTNII